MPEVMSGAGAGGPRANGCVGVGRRGAFGYAELGKA